MESVSYTNDVKHREWCLDTGVNSDEYCCLDMAWIFFSVHSLQERLAPLILEWIQTHSKIKGATAMAFVFSGFLALGVMLITTLKSKLDLHSFLFGDILGVTSTDLWRTLIIAIAVLSCVAIFYRELIFYIAHPNESGSQCCMRSINVW